MRPWEASLESQRPVPLCPHGDRASSVSRARVLGPASPPHAVTWCPPSDEAGVRFSPLCSVRTRFSGVYPPCVGDFLVIHVLFAGVELQGYMEVFRPPGLCLLGPHRAKHAPTAQARPLCLVTGWCWPRTCSPCPGGERRGGSLTVRVTRVQHRPFPC